MLLAFNTASALHFGGSRASFPGASLALAFPSRIQAAPRAADNGTTERWINKVLSNINEGKLGTRGELWFFGQLLFVAGVLFTPFLPLVPLASGFGFLSLLAGALLVGFGVVELGNSLSPWTAPSSSNELKTGGPFVLCRHPIYTGLVALCAGLGLVSHSSERLLLTALLFIFLTQKAASEEARLEALHGDVYRQWAAVVPAFIPDWSTFESSFDGWMESAFRQVGLLKEDK